MGNRIKRDSTLWCLLVTSSLGVVIMVTVIMATTQVHLKCNSSLPQPAALRSPPTLHCRSVTTP